MTFPFSPDWPASAVIPQSALNDIQSEFFQTWQQLMQAASKGDLPPVTDRRFAGEAWASSPTHLFMAHLYLLSAHSVQRLVDAADTPPDLKERLRFSMSQWLDAMSPANFFATNPDAQQALLKSGGETLMQGMQNFLADLNKGRITHSDETKFKVGENLAVTPGAVVFQNRLFQLIQYSPTTTTVFQRPILLIPPCINKFYILDLQQDNSLVRHLVGQGFTVYLMSWRNPLPEDKDGIENATWDQYIEEGALKAIHVVQEISEQKKINVLGFCVGGTILATALAVLAARGEDPVASLTMLTSMVDFSDTGALKVFVDEQHVSMREQALAKGGLMTARELGATFSFLRPNELVWNYVVSNYLKGETPMAFDLLYWNGDSTNLPGPFFTWYFRHTYLQNELKQPGKLTCCGVPIDLGKIHVPAYLYGSREDHIVPWRSAYASTQIFGGPSRFVLGASGHIAGVINPPAKKKRNYWVSDTDRHPKDADQWLEMAHEIPGSWWPDWMDWLAGHSGKKVKAPTQAGGNGYKVLEPAPGSFVRVRAV